MGLVAIIIRFVQFEYCVLFKDVTVIQGFHWTRIGQTILIRLRDDAATRRVETPMREYNVEFINHSLCFRLGQWKKR